jgi:hypothetical protein
MEPKLVYGSGAWDAMFSRLLHAELGTGNVGRKIDEYPWGVSASDGGGKTLCRANSGYRLKEWIAEGASAE